ncbi:MAG: PEP-CTERM sorting domain-containing protein [Candidatus Acidiferrales bacterium]
MRLVKTLCLVALVAISAAAAHAGSIGSDPKVTINCTKNCPGVVGNAIPLVSQPFSPPTGFKTSMPLILGFHVGETFDFTYEGPDVTLSPSNHNALQKYLYIFIQSTPTDPIPPGTQFSCGGTLFSFCTNAFLGNNLGPGEGFEFSGGSLITGEQLSVSETPLVGETPEPSTMLMFFSLGPALAFAKKRWNARQSA